MKVKLLISFLILILIFGLMGCGNARRNEEIKNYLEEFENINNRFMDKYDLAGTTARIALSPVISEMQDAMRELGNLDVPDIKGYGNRLSGVKELDLSGMDKAIRGFQLFQMEDEDLSLFLLGEADEIFLSVNNTIIEIRTELNK